MSTALEFLKQAHEEGATSFPRRVRFEREVIKAYEEALQAFREAVADPSQVSPADGGVFTGQLHAWQQAIEYVAQGWGWVDDRG